MVPVLFHTTLIRDQNGLGFSIAGGEGSQSFKDNSDVSFFVKLNIFQICLLKLANINYYMLSLQAIYISRITDGGVAQKDGKLLVGDKVMSVSIYIFIRFETNFYWMNTS